MKNPEPKPVVVKGADYTWSCGCYDFCGNLIACKKHSPYRAATKEKSDV